jgi:hypothetical protein
MDCASVAALYERRNLNDTFSSCALSAITDRRYRIPLDREAVSWSIHARLRLPISSSAKHVVAGAAGV